MIILERPIVFVDLETTGTNVETDRIVEISMCKWDGTNRIVKTARFNPTIPIPKAASDVHGITDEDVKDCPTFKQKAKGILEFISGCDLGGFNSSGFDFPILYYEFNRAEIDWDYTQHNMVDAGNLYKIFEPRTLAAAYKFYCGKVLENAHSAEADINGTLDVFEAQMERYKDQLPTTIAEIALKSNFDKKRADIGGKIGFNDKGEHIFNFGKHTGKRLQDEIEYCGWIITSNFPPDVKRIARQYSNKLPF